MNKLTAFLTIVIAAFSFSAKSMIINVDANAHMISVGNGASTGYFLTEGDVFSASVDEHDLWSVYRHSTMYWTDANGLDGDLFATGTDDSGLPAGTLIGTNRGLGEFVPGLRSHAGTLLGSIDGNFFVIGTNFTGSAIATGELLLWMADGGPQNNFGSIAVTLDAVAVSEPSVIVLFALGLIALLYSRTKQTAPFRATRVS